MDLIGIGKIALGFTILIASHEFGHALAAILCNVPVKKFSIGIGPGIKIPIPKINYLIISPIVIGGFVELDEEALSEKSFLKKLFVYSAGILMNILLTLVILCSLEGSLMAGAQRFFVWINLFISTLMGGAPTEFAGPIGIGKLFLMKNYWQLIALISLNLAVFNLIPIPPLDGGRIFISILGKIIGNGNAALVNRVLTLVGVVALLSFLIFATFHDIARLTH